MTVTPMPRQLERRASAVPLRQAPGLAGSSGVSSSKAPQLRPRVRRQRSAARDACLSAQQWGQVSTLPSIVLRDPHGTRRRA